MPRTRIAPHLLVLVLIGMCTATAQDVPSDATRAVPKGDRLLGLGINEGAIGFEKAFAAAREAGMQFVELPSQWDDIEPKPGEFTNQWLDIANTYYPAVGIQLDDELQLPCCKLYALDAMLELNANAGATKQ